MATSILSIGSGALNAAQAGLATTSHNISNAATPGYSRQQTLQAANNPLATGIGFLGQGVHVVTVRRIYDEFLTRQVGDTQASVSQFDAFHGQIAQIDNLLADPASGLSPAIQEFFTGVNAVANNPADIAARQSMLSAGQSLVSRLQILQGQFDRIRDDTQGQIAASVEAINGYAAQIAQINDAIAKAEAGVSGHTANDLRDQRDLLIADLNKEIKTTVVRQDDGAYNVFIGNGQPLVMGISAAALTAMPSAADPSRLDIGFKSGNVVVPIQTSTLAGGKLGGLLSFRDTALDPAVNTLGRIALGLAGTFNAQHRQGFDLTGLAGGDFFSVAAPDVLPNAHNAGSASLSVAISGPGALAGSDYQLRYDGTQYAITRLADGDVQTTASLPITRDGLDFSLSSGTMAAGDSFLIRATANGAGKIGVALTDPRQIAAAAAAPGAGDNRNALALAELQTRNMLGNGTATYQSAYAQFVSQVGNQTRAADVASQTQAKLLEQAKSAREGLSGVNLDEEAANLLRYQQAYQAAGKVMQIASTLFDTLLSLGK
jgi:flagellar hook-associated protein 1 FlgK